MIKSNVRVLIAQKEQAEEIRLSYQDISAATGISLASISMLANNQSKMISLKTLDRLCTFFGVGPSEVLLWTPD